MLDLRKIEEEQKKRNVGVLQTQINACQQEAIEFSDQIKLQGLMLKEDMIKGDIDRRQIAYYQGYVTAMRKRIAERIERVREIQKDLIVAREEYTRAARRTKVMEKLKERRKERYDSELKRIEIRQNDEMGQNLFLRNRNRDLTEG